MSECTLNTLKSHLHKAAFLVARPDGAEAAHKEILTCLVLAEQLQQHDMQTRHVTSSRAVGDHSRSYTSDERTEVAKVQRRLRLWARRPTQINSQILRAFLQARREGIQPVTEDAIRERISDPSSFESNFAQMKSIAPKNHGKVFEQIGLEVRVWPPVSTFVQEFEQRVF